MAVASRNRRGDRSRSPERKLENRAKIPLSILSSRPNRSGAGTNKENARWRVDPVGLHPSHQFRIVVESPWAPAKARAGAKAGITSVQATPDHTCQHRGPDRFLDKLKPSREQTIGLHDFRIVSTHDYD